MFHERRCPKCHMCMRCVYTGCDVYLAHTNEVHPADLFMCLDCKTFHVFGMNNVPLRAWKKVDGAKVSFLPTPNVVVGGSYTLVPYGPKSSFSYVDGGEVIPLPEALKYMIEECGHMEEVSAYLTKRKKEWRIWRNYSRIRPEENELVDQGRHGARDFDK